MLDISPALVVSSFAARKAKVGKEEKVEEEEGDIRLNYLMTCLLMLELSLELLSRRPYLLE
jgi:hypothetical protein